MPTEGGGSGGSARDIRAALAEELARLGAGARRDELGAEDHRNELEAEDRGEDLGRADGPNELDAADYHWLGVGLRLGIEHPDAARRLLALLETPDAGRARAEDAGTHASDVPGPASRTPRDRATGDFRSTLLARSAAMPLSERAGPDPRPMFGWVAALTATEILAVGRVVDEMLASGSSRDISRGFGIAWDAGVRLAREELEAMIAEFAEMQIAVGGVLAGRDLQAGPVVRRRGVSGLLDPWLSRTSTTEAQASAVIQASGEVAQQGLVALWNAWAGLRYRPLIPRPTFELLVRPWETVIGPLPES